MPILATSAFALGRGSPGEVCAVGRAVVERLPGVRGPPDEQGALCFARTLGPATGLVAVWLVKSAPDEAADVTLLQLCRRLNQLGSRWRQRGSEPATFTVNDSFSIRSTLAWVV